MIKTLILNAYKANIEQLTGPDKLPEGIAKKRAPGSRLL